MTSPPRPTCFVAMPFGKKAPPGKKTPIIDFNSVYEMIRVAVEAEHLECVRADFEPSGGFIHRAMFERLLVSEFVIADLTFANPNVTYELGLRHAGSSGTTLLIGEEASVRRLPFDVAPLRVLPYAVAKTGRPLPSRMVDFSAELRARLAMAKRHELPLDNPILQVTKLQPALVGHEKTDVFLQRMAYANEVGQRIRETLNLSDRQQALDKLKTIESELLGGRQAIAQLHTAILGLFLAYRAKKAFAEMVSLFEHMDPELRNTAVAREQVALAENRLSEKAAKRSEHKSAIQHRQRALDALDAIPKPSWTSETHGIQGRIFKGQADAEEIAGQPAAARTALGNAIAAYEAGFRSDPRDYFPGVNAVTLRILRQGPGDEDAVPALATVVHFSVMRASPPTNEDERYWQTATKLELVCARRDWATAENELGAALMLNVASFYYETTADNIGRQARARKADTETASRLLEIEKKLRTKVT